jgi:hypothetical protein
MNFALKSLLAAAVAASCTTTAFAEGDVPKGVRHLDHVFLIMMENHGYAEVAGNPQMPFVNSLAKQGALAANYFAVAHPSLTNELWRHQRQLARLAQRIVHDQSRKRHSFAR